MSIHSRVHQILTKQGETVTYRTLTGITRNADLSNTPAYTSYTVQAHIRLFEAKEISDIIAEGDRQMRIAADALSVVPKKNDEVVINSQRFNVIGCDRRTAYGTDALYILHIRGSDG